MWIGLLAIVTAIPISLGQPHWPCGIDMILSAASSGVPIDVRERCF